MHLELRASFLRGATLFAFALAAVTTTLATTLDDAPFLAENDAAMAKMMTAMEIKPSGDME